MNCEKCGKQVATVHLTEIVGNEKREVNLCPQCAAQQGITVPAPSGIEFLTGLIDQHMSKELAAMAGIKCPECGHTLLAFRTQGRLGCPKDYEVFGKALKPLLERMHGSVEHVGKVPANASGEMRRLTELTHLHRELRRAVDQEDFERAAHLRDAIRQKEEARGS